MSQNISHWQPQVLINYLHIIFWHATSASCNSVMRKPVVAVLYGTNKLIIHRQGHFSCVHGTQITMLQQACRSRPAICTYTRLTDRHIMIKGTYTYKCVCVMYVHIHLQISDVQRTMCWLMWHASVSDRKMFPAHYSNMVGKNTILNAIHWTKLCGPD